jgi:DNA polymerase-3 subunit beta
MRLSCLQENFTKGLAIVGRAVATRSTLPVAQNVLLSTDRSMLKLSATNLEIGITTWIGAMVEEEGEITVPARLLTEFVASLPNEKIDLTMSGDTKAIQVTCARAEARINGTDAEEFPPIPTIEGGLVAKLDSRSFRTAIDQVVFAAATEESRPVLTGVKLELEGDAFTLAAADGFRLAVHKGKLAEPVVEPVTAIIPSKTLNELGRFLSDREEMVEMMITPVKGQVLFRLENIQVVSQLIQGTFPNYSQLIPEGYQTRAVIDLQAFQRAVRTSSIFARDGSGIIRLQMVPGADGSTGKIIVSARAEEIGDNTGEVDTEMDGEDAKIAFSSRYLIDVLSALGKGKVVLEASSPSSPGVFRTAGAEDYVHVVMPMFVQW